MESKPQGRWSARAWRDHPGLAAFDAGAFVLLLLLLYGATRVEGGAAAYNWQWHRVPQFLYDAKTGRAGPLLTGLGVTLKVCGLALVCALVFGLLGALGRLSRGILARTLARAYVETIRNTPLLVQIFLVYFVLAPVLSLPRLWAAVLSLALFEGAYIAEILRAGIVGIERGQWEAAGSLALSPWQTYRHVVLPQAIRRVLPPLTGQTVSLVKDSALVSVIAVYDLTMQGRAIIAETFLTFEIWFAVAGVYLVLTLSLSTLSRHLEHRLTPETGAA